MMAKRLRRVVGTGSLKISPASLGGRGVSSSASIEIAELIAQVRQRLQS